MHSFGIVSFRRLSFKPMHYKYINDAVRWCTNGVNTEYNDMITYLSDKGYSLEISQCMLKSFTDGNVPVTSIQTMNDQVLKSLGDACEREIEIANINKQKPEVNVFIQIPYQNEVTEMKAHVGDNILNLCNTNPILKRSIVCACGGIAACSTCHVYIDDEAQYQSLNPPQEEEEDMLDLATDFVPGKSRLGCQLKLTENNNNIVLRVPEEVNDLYNK